MAKQRRSRAVLHERAEQRGLLAALVLGRREVLGLRQEELADLAGCSPRFVHELEAGKPTVQLDKVLDVLNAIGLHLELADGGAAGVLATSNLLTEFGIARDESAIGTDPRAGVVQ
jgi:HTH-type transcriptional regulator/antitoxin HipB